MTSPQILAGDIGGTKTVVGRFEMRGDELHLVSEPRVYASHEHDSLEEILSDFLSEADAPSPAAACFGVAGAVLDGNAKVTNLSWQIRTEKLSEILGTGQVAVINDLEAAGYGMIFLPETSFAVLQRGATDAPSNNIGIIAAGTGLGEGMLYWDGAAHHPIASEGGHADFAPRNDLEIALLCHLRSQFGDHVSYERILSGPGLVHIYAFLRERANTPEPEWLTAAIDAGDPGAAISSAGLEKRDSVCVDTLQLFASAYGAEAGNLALRAMALGGVYIGGGIAPKILPALEDGNFMEAFLAKGRFRRLLERIPVRISLDPLAPLIGAAHFALRI